MCIKIESNKPIDLNDPLFNEPYIDIDEWREDPVRHRYNRF